MFTIRVFPQGHVIGSVCATVQYSLRRWTLTLTRVDESLRVCLMYVTSERRFAPASRHIIHRGSKYTFPLPKKPTSLVPTILSTRLIVNIDVTVCVSSSLYCMRIIFDISPSSCCATSSDDDALCGLKAASLRRWSQFPPSHGISRSIRRHNSRHFCLLFTTLLIQQAQEFLVRFHLRHGMLLFTFQIPWIEDPRSIGFGRQ